MPTFPFSISSNNNFFSVCVCASAIYFCWFSCVRKLFEIHKSFMHIHHVLKLMNHLRGFPMMNGRCCIGNNNDVSLFISAFFFACLHISFGCLFSAGVFIGIVLSFHYMCSRKKQEYNSHFMYAFRVFVIY